MRQGDRAGSARRGELGGPPGIPASDSEPMFRRAVRWTLPAEATSSSVRLQVRTLINTAHPLDSGHSSWMRLSSTALTSENFGSCATFLSSLVSKSLSAAPGGASSAACEYSSSPRMHDAPVDHRGPTPTPSVFAPP